jgi:hypothetical protein
MLGRVLIICLVPQQYIFCLTPPYPLCFGRLLAASAPPSSLETVAYICKPLRWMRNEEVIYVAVYRYCYLILNPMPSVC